MKMRVATAIARRPSLSKHFFHHKARGLNLRLLRISVPHVLLEVPKRPL